MVPSGLFMSRRADRPLRSLIVDILVTALFVAAMVSLPASEAKPKKAPEATRASVRR